MDESAACTLCDARFEYWAAVAGLFTLVVCECSRVWNTFLRCKVEPLYLLRDICSVLNDMV